MKPLHAALLLSALFAASALERAEEMQRVRFEDALRNYRRRAKAEEAAR